MIRIQKPIAITIGEPAGVGPELLIQLLQTSYDTPLVIIGNQVYLESLAQKSKLSLNLTPYSNFSDDAPPALYIIDLPLAAPVVASQLNVANANFVMNMLSRAAEGALNGEFSAIVTGPVHKGILNEAGFKFSGHTEFFAEKSALKKPVMLLMNNKAKIALVTTHIPLKDVPSHITEKNLNDTLSILHHGLKTQFAIENPRIGVCGLNPHAGENGYLGREEIDTIIPCLNKLREKGLHLIGPLPADTAFLPAQLSQLDALVAMYHDQGLPVVKQMDFANTVNVTLGLPFIRTSVDHGTALDLAGKGRADASSFKAALNMAMRLVFSCHPSESWDPGDVVKKKI